MGTQITLHFYLYKILLLDLTHPRTFFSMIVPLKSVRGLQCLHCYRHDQCCGSGSSRILFAGSGTDKKCHKKSCKSNLRSFLKNAKERNVLLKRTDAQPCYLDRVLAYSTTMWTECQHSQQLFGQGVSIVNNYLDRFSA